MLSAWRVRKNKTKQIIVRAFIIQKKKGDWENTEMEWLKIEEFKMYCEEI